MKTLRLLLAVTFSAIALEGIGQKKVPQKAPEINMFCSAKLPQRKSALPSDTATTRGLMDNYYLWNQGTTLRVKILTGSKQLRDLVISAAREWEKYANIRFEFVDYGETNIRILLAEGLGHNSSLGIQCNSVSQDQQTMNIDTTNFFWEGKFYPVQFKGTVVHELGHAIGFLHEHFSPVSNINWNKEAVYKDIMESDGWTKEEIDYNLFQTFALSYTNGTKYDNKSVMHYYIKPNWTYDGYSVKSNYVLSEGDKELARIAYPPSSEMRSTEVPRFAISGFVKTNVIDNSTKQGFSYYPTFNINTAGRAGQIVMIAYILDKDNNFIPHKLNPDNIVGTAQTFNLAAPKNLTVNKGTKDIEFFIPYSAIDMAPGKNDFKVWFVVKLIDKDEVKYLFRSDPISFSKTIK